MLNKIYAQQKVMNRNLQRISNVMLMMVFACIGKDAKAREDEQGKMLCKIGLGLTAVLQGLLLVSDIVDLVKSKNQIECDETIDEIDK